MISVLLPSRKRPELLRKSIESLADTASGPREFFEVLVAVDPDDDETFRAAAFVGADMGVRVHVIRTMERYGYSRIYDYYNLLAEEAIGEFLMLWNDDAVMTTHGWNERIEELPESVLVGDLQSNMSAGGWICFPAIRRSLYEALGHFSLPNPHVDSYLQDLGRALGRVHPVDVWIEHNRPDLTGEIPDATFLEGRTGLRHHEYFSSEFQALIAEDVERVRISGI